MTKIPAILSWSGGKDSALCLNKVIEEGKYEVKYLLTTLSEVYKRISMHGIRESLLEAQAKSLGIPLIKMYVGEASNAAYEESMREALNSAKQEGINHVIFGDIFLEDLRSYREQNLSQIGMEAVFPLWHYPTEDLIHDFVSQGFRSQLCCVNDAFLDESWLGKEIDVDFLEYLPVEVDPCGENGEYHSFCYAGPIFNPPLNIKKGEIIFKPLEIKMEDDCSLDKKPITRGFWFLDILED